MLSPVIANVLFYSDEHLKDVTCGLFVYRIPCDGLLSEQNRSTDLVLVRMAVIHESSWSNGNYISAKIWSTKIYITK